MNHFFNTRFASMALAIGFFLACSSSKPTIDSLVENSMYDEALTEIEASLQANPEQPNLLIKKGEIYLSIAEQSEPANRLSSYDEAQNAFSEAAEMDITSAQAADLSQQLYQKWEEEFNAGTELVDQDKNLETAHAHFTNAITLQPAQSKPYISSSVVLYQLSRLDEAIAVLTDAKNTLDPIPAKVYENLGFLYLQSGDTKNSVFYYELANTDITENKNIAFGLVNTYILDNEVEKAVDILGDLSGNFPDDAQIKNVYGTQLYTISAGILDDLQEAYQSEDSGLVSQIKFEAEGVSEQAEEELISAYQLDSSNEEYVESLAVFYNNMLGKYLAVHDVAFEEDKEAYLVKAEILLDFAIQYYEKLSSFNPEDTQVTNSIETLKKLKEIKF